MTVRFSARFLARAIKAAMDAARATILGKSFSKMLPGPVKPHGEVIPRYAQRRRDFIRLLSLQINFFQQLPILLGHQRQKTPKAFAELPLILFAGCFRNPAHRLREDLIGQAQGRPDPARGKFRGPASTP